MNKETVTGLSKLREPFPTHQVGKLAKGSKAQTQCQASEKKNCTVCGGWHHPKMIHLDYVGHAALTDRLLDADLHWTWEPMSFTPEGLPLFDASGGLWIRLTVCGHSRIGYGHAPASEYKEIGSREKEVIGDALRNAAMRFGSALEKWHKGELHLQEEDGIQSEKKVGVNERIKGDTFVGGVTQVGILKDSPAHKKPDVSDGLMATPQKRKFFAMCNESEMNKGEQEGFRAWLKTVKYQDPLTKDQASGIIEKFMDHVEEYQAWKFAGEKK